MNINIDPEVYSCSTIACLKNITTVKCVLVAVEIKSPSQVNLRTLESAHFSRTDIALRITVDHYRYVPDDVLAVKKMNSFRLAPTILYMIYPICGILKEEYKL